MILQSPSNIFDMTKSLMKLQEKYLESIRIDYKLSRIEVIIITFLHNNPVCYSVEMYPQPLILSPTKAI